MPAWVTLENETLSQNESERWGKGKDGVTMPPNVSWHTVL